ncbi:hypothetical protein BTVI_50596 [Pitangus sulphuratus]|nr:hypothetical protein BTVI_50596 [Pitangus sulphuratus]
MGSWALGESVFSLLVILVDLELVDLRTQKICDKMVVLAIISESIVWLDTTVKDKMRIKRDFDISFQTSYEQLAKFEQYVLLAFSFSPSNVYDNKPK